MRNLLKTSLICLLLFNLTGLANTTDKLQQVNSAIKNTALISKIKAKYAFNPILTGAPIHITTSDGHVILSGQVESAIQYSAAIVLAQNTSGVKDISTQQLRIAHSKHPDQDSKIEAKIHDKLVSDHLMEDHSRGIVIEAVDGDVYLAGLVDSYRDRLKIVNLAESVDGVHQVRDDIRIVQILH